jgi:ProP effector
MSITKARIDEVITLLATRFPKTFFVHEAHRRPLKLGIHRDIGAVLGDVVDRRTLHAVLRYYVSNIAYRKSQQAGVDRIDLDGNAAGVVTELEAVNAQKGVAQQKRKPKTVEMPPPGKPAPRRDGLAALKQAAARRKAVA